MNDWSRVELKERAKGELRISFWLSYAVCLVGGFITGGLTFLSSYNGINLVYRILPASYAARSSIHYSYSPYSQLSAAILSAAIVGALFGIAISLLYTIFVGNPISVGMRKFFIESPSGNRDFQLLFWGFREGRYMKIVKATWKPTVFTFLWSLLFVIPGIIKSYQWRFVPYLLAENPDLSADEVMASSTRMTDGNKMDMFILDLSFLGWMILAGFVGGIASSILFFLGGIVTIAASALVQPYIQGTYAQLYFVLRDNQPGEPGGTRQVIDNQ